MSENDTHASPISKGLIWVGFGSMIALVMLRAMSEHDAFPWWQSDPFVFSPPVIGMTPIKALILNMGVLLSCLIAFIGFMKAGFQFGKLRSILFSLGSIGVITHGLLSPETIFEGSNLLAVMSVLYLSSLAHCVPDVQRIITGITFGFVLVLIIIGAHEVFVVHPETISNYKVNRDSFLMARGWAPDSFQTLAYERRLYQPEPIAWFGLTNVFASFVAAGDAGWLYYSLQTRSHNRFWGIGLLCSIVCLLGLLLSGAKGGMGALLLGVLFTAIAVYVPQLKIDGRKISILCALVILGVLGRGLIGERIGELSLLFRSQYMSGSMSMYLDHPVLGVGPGAFQEHYSIVKPDLSPEDVASAHSFPFDLIAALGFAGIAFIAFCVMTLSKIRPSSVSESLAESHQFQIQIPKRQAAQLILLIIAVAMVISLRMNAPAMDQELLLIHVLAWIAWSIVALVITRSSSTGSAIRWGTFAAATVLSIHSMIEVTAIWMVSGMLWALMIGNACTDSPITNPEDEKAKSARRAMSFPVYMSLLSLLGGIVMIALQVPGISRWESSLNHGAEPAVQVSQIKHQLNELEHSVAPNLQIEEIASALSLLTETHVPASIDRIVESLDQTEIAGRQYAIEQLLVAHEYRPTHTPTVIAATQQMLYLASVAQTKGELESSRLYWDQAIDLLRNHASTATGSNTHHWFGNVLWNRALEFVDDDQRTNWLGEADQIWRIAFERSPHDPHQALKLMELAQARNQPSETLKWAQKAFDLHNKSRLDPLRGLSDEELASVRLILGVESN